MTSAQLCGLIFSKDRPLQLDATLRSFARCCRDAQDVPLFVLYVASDGWQGSLYRQLRREHPGVVFVRETSFRRDLLLLLQHREHVLFVVDDCVFVREFAAADVIASLRAHPDALGFSLRLGRNTVYCYAFNQPQKLPAFQTVSETILKFRWVEQEHDFGYPLELSSSVYRGDELRPLLESLQFNNPNSLEEALWTNVPRFRESHPSLLCPTQSCAFCAPVNKVQQACPNRAGQNVNYSVAALAQSFAEGQQIDIKPLAALVPNACHQEVEFKFTPTGSRVPRVSVVIPCYKQAQFLGEAVESVVAQTYPDWEVIIVNDGSPDDTSAVARALIARHPARQIRLIEKLNGGPSDTRNVGVQAAAGMYILPLDADDLIVPTMLEQVVALLDAEPDVAIAYTDVQHFGAAQRDVQAAEFDPEKITANNQLNYCSLYRREVWEHVGGYNCNMTWGYEDWDFWVGCSEQGFRAQRVPGLLLQYRVKASSRDIEAVAHDQALRARIILNHPTLYDADCLHHAREVLAAVQFPTPAGAPKVSVIVPTYNRPDRLEETLRSILNQTFQDFEILVINDAGFDVGHVLARLPTARRILYLQHAVNQGLAAARNTGLRFARGKYIAYLDDDDIFLPNHLETLVLFLENTDHQVAYTDAYCAHETLVENRYQIAHRDVPHSSDWDNDRILAINIAPVLCFLHARTCVDQVGGFDEQLTTHEDWEFWLRLSRKFSFHHLKQVTCEFRVREDGTSMSSSRRADFLRTAKLIFQKYRTEAAGKPVVKEQQVRLLQGLAREVGQFNSTNDRPFMAWWRRVFPPHR